MGDCEKAGREKLGCENAECEEKPALPENPRLPEEPACEPPCCAKAGRASARRATAARNIMGIFYA